MPFMQKFSLRKLSVRTRSARVLSALALVAAVASVHAKEIAPTLEMSANGEIQIAPDGHVSDYRLQSQLPPAVAALVDKDVKQWLFEPILIDGKGVTAKTSMQMRLHAEAIPGKEAYNIRINDVRFGGPRPDHIKPPHYPPAGVSARVGARVMLALRLDEAGGVADVQVYQTSLNVRTNSEMQAESFRKIFEHASVEAAHGWHYDLSETLNGKRIGTVALVPVEFSLVGNGMRAPQDGEWRAYVPGPLHSIPWLRDDKFASNLDSLQNGEAASTDSHFHLKNDVVGKTL